MADVPPEHESAYRCADTLARLLRRTGPVTLTAAERLKPLTGKIRFQVDEETGDLTVEQDDEATE